MVPLGRRHGLRLAGLKLIFLMVSSAGSVLGLSRRQAWGKDAEILMLRHQLAVAQCERPRAHSRLKWLDRAWLALLAGERVEGYRRIHGELAGLGIPVAPPTVCQVLPRGAEPPARNVSADEGRATS
jgi:hypothetical protein